LGANGVGLQNWDSMIRNRVGGPRRIIPRSAIRKIALRLEVFGRYVCFVLLIRRRTGPAGTRLAALTTRKAGRGSITARHALAPGAYTLVLTAVTGGSARIVDTVPLVVRKA